MDKNIEEPINNNNLDKEGLFFLVAAKIELTSKGVKEVKDINITWKNEDYSNLVTLFQINTLMDDCAKQFISLYPSYDNKDTSIDAITIMSLSPLGMGTYEEFLKGIPANNTNQ